MQGSTKTEFNYGMNFFNRFQLAVGEAFAAIYGLVQTWFERNLGFLSALCANSIEQFPFSFCRTVPAELGLSRGSAFLAPAGFILEAFGSVELLLPCSEYEFLSTILAH
jgi:hypothetical protein